MGNAYYFSHDYNARNDPKIMALIKAYGMEGYGRWWVVVETMAEQADYKLQNKPWQFDALAMTMLCDANAVTEFINDCITQFELFVSDGSFFWSESLMRRMELREEKKKKRSEAAKRGAENRWNKPPDDKGKKPDKSPKDPKVYEEGSNELEAAKAMLRLIRSINPDYKEPKLQKWASEFDKIFRIDKRNPQELQEVMKWVYNDSFWRGVILSPAKLREKYDALNTKRKSQRNSDGQSSNYEPPH